MDGLSEWVTPYSDGDEREPTETEKFDWGRRDADYEEYLIKQAEDAYFERMDRI